jgi:hypothetical protein
MPTKLREFYWRELLKAKEEEKKQYESISKSGSSSKIRRR